MRLYSKMEEGSGSFANGGNGSLIHLTGLSSDEFINYNAVSEYAMFYSNTLNQYNSIVLPNNNYNLPDPGRLDSTIKLFGKGVHSWLFV